MVSQRKKTILWTAVILLLAVIAIAAHYQFDPWGFYWKVSDDEAALRMKLVETAESYLGYNETDGSHEQIIDRYNAHEPLAVGYTVQYEDSWCSTFVSTVSITCGLTDIIPTECGCERHIGLFQELGVWEERDDIIPLPGDLIFYDWNMEEKGQCTGWSDHVGIVAGTKWPFIKVIEGNFDDSVACRYLRIDDVQIRGFAKPDYASLLNNKTP
jgi:hypothetical protein